MEGLMTLVVLGSVAAVAIPLAVLLEWWSVRGLLALVATHSQPKRQRFVAQACPERSRRVPARRAATGLI